MAESKSALEEFQAALGKARERETRHYKIVGCRGSGEFMKALSDEARRYMLSEGDQEMERVQLRRYCDVMLYIGLVEKLEFDFGYVSEGL